MLRRSVEHGAGAELMACNVHSCASHHVRTFQQTEVVALCHLLRLIVSTDDAARTCLLDPHLFRDLSLRARENATVAAAVLEVFWMGRVCDVSHAYAMAEHAAHRLITDFTGVPKLVCAADGGPTGVPHLENALRFLQLLATDLGWHAHLSQWVVTLSRYGWPPVFGPLVAAMLTPPSVHFVVALERGGRLDALARAVNDHAAAEACTTRDAWLVARGRLRAAWPSRFAEAVRRPSECRTDPVTAIECPVTLQPCVYPATASDGHTYERDALLRIMVGSDAPRSPVTKAPLLFFVFDNYAVHDA